MNFYKINNPISYHIKIIEIQYNFSTTIFRYTYTKKNALPKPIKTRVREK